ncbi:hypothetical protein LIER_39154 [Lithospermum erythrorhizon]|uniref:Retrotransposon Copia-like N-terminal domain-containing protein n=1 Tax=Lithospermum erythrorhizon TaxID=34254 RepID=A0AAV3QD22_LITER
MSSPNQTQNSQIENQNASRIAEIEVATSKIEVDDPLFLHSSDHSSLVLVLDLLNESNYVGWSRAMMITLEGNDKLGFLNGEIETLGVNDANYK